MHISQLLYGNGSLTNGSIRILLASLTSPPYVGKQLTVLLHTQQRLSRYHVYCNVVPTINSVF